MNLAHTNLPTQSLLAISAALAVLGTGNEAIADIGDYYAGTAAGGQQVILDLDSMHDTGNYSANFIYYLGNERILSEAICAGGGAWITLDDGVMHHPQSRATRNMMRAVCDFANFVASGEIALVYAPPSNVRAEPNGTVVCTVSQMSYININGSIGDWHMTDFCQETGFIHHSQIRL